MLRPILIITIKRKNALLRDSQKTIGSVTGRQKYGVMIMAVLDEHPEPENFITSWTPEGLKFKPVDEEEFYCY